MPKAATAGKARILFLIDEIGGIAEGGTERQVLQLIELATRLGYEPRLAVLRGTEWLTAKAGRVSDLLCWSEQSAASYPDGVRVRQSGAAGCGRNEFLWCKHFLSNATFLAHGWGGWQACR